LLCIFSDSPVALAAYKDDFSSVDNSLKPHSLSDIWHNCDFYFSENELTESGFCQYSASRLLLALQLNSDDELPAKPTLTILSLFTKNNSLMTKSSLALWLHEHLNDHKQALGTRRIEFILDSFNNILMDPTTHSDQLLASVIRLITLLVPPIYSLSATAAAPLIAKLARVLEVVETVSSHLVYLWRMQVEALGLLSTVVRCNQKTPLSASLAFTAMGLLVDPRFLCHPHFLVRCESGKRIGQVSASHLLSLYFFLFFPKF